MKIKVTEKQIADALRNTHGCIEPAAHALGLSRNAVYDRTRKSPKLSAILDEYQQGLLDQAEARLAEAVLRGDRWAVTFLLSTKGKTRGYGKVQEITGPNGTPLVPAQVNMTDEELRVIAGLAKDPA